MNELGKKVLIVEDEEPMLRLLSEGLQKAGYATISARDGEVALTSALENRPDLILLDIMLPKINGLMMLENLRKGGGLYGKDVPVILLTNLSPDNEQVNKVIAETSPTYYFVKSDWTVEEVIEKVKERLNPGRSIIS